MADKLKFDLVSPERLLFSEQVDMVTVPGTEGEMGVLAHHAPVMTTLRPGIIRIESDGKETGVFVWGGFAEVNASGLTVLAEEAMPMDEINLDDLGQRIKNLEEDVADFEDADRKEDAADRLWHVRQMFEAARRG